MTIIWQQVIPQKSENGHDAEHRAIHRRLRDLFYVPDYSSLADAVGAASAAGGGQVVLPSGETLVTETVDVPPLVTLCGQGERVSILRAGIGLGSAPVLRVTYSAYSSRTCINDLKVDGQGVASHGILYTHTAYNRLERVNVIGCDRGVEMQSGAWGNVLRDCFISDGSSGVVLDSTNGQINANLIDHCGISSHSDYGVFCHGGTSNRFTHNMIEHNQIAGFRQVAGGILPTIAYCHFELNGLVEAPGDQIIIGDEMNVCNPQIIGNYFYGGEDTATSTPGWCNHALHIIKASDAVAHGNFAWGHIEQAALYEAGVSCNELVNSWH